MKFVFAIVVLAVLGAAYCINLTPILARTTCSKDSTCDGIANAYRSDRGVGCSTSCGGSYKTFADAGVPGLKYCFKWSAPTGTQFIESCYCCFGYVYDNATNTCIDPDTCTKGFGVY